MPGFSPNARGFGTLGSVALVSRKGQKSRRSVREWIRWRTRTRARTCWSPFTFLEVQVGDGSGRATWLAEGVDGTHKRRSGRKRIDRNQRSETIKPTAYSCGTAPEFHRLRRFNALGGTIPSINFESAFRTTEALLFDRANPRLVKRSEVRPPNPSRHVELLAGLVASLPEM